MRLKVPQGIKKYVLIPYVLYIFTTALGPPPVAFEIISNIKIRPVQQL